MGLQYFEAVSPATIASIVAVLTNRLLTGNDATGYYVYPFLNESLPSELFMRAIVYGLFGGAVGMFYVKVVLYLKHYDFFFDNCNGNVQQGPRVSRFKGGNIVGEGTGLLQSVGDISNQRQESAKKLPPLTNHFRREPNRAATLGALTGVLVGIVCMFIPHVMFWGEDQLQTLIDNGRTPLPIFGHGNETSADILALSYCVVRNDTSTQDHFESQSALGCSFGKFPIHIPLFVVYDII
jgi:H+/Cl- antiporter ClcA